MWSHECMNKGLGRLRTDKFPNLAYLLSKPGFKQQSVGVLNSYYTQQSGEPSKTNNSFMQLAVQRLFIATITTKLKWLVASGIAHSRNLQCQWKIVPNLALISSMPYCKWCSSRLFVFNLWLIEISASRRICSCPLLFVSLYIVFPFSLTLQC